MNTWIMEKGDVSNLYDGDTPVRLYRDLLALAHNRVDYIVNFIVENYINSNEDYIDVDMVYENSNLRAFGRHRELDDNGGINTLDPVGKITLVNLYEDAFPLPRDFGLVEVTDYEIKISIDCLWKEFEPSVYRVLESIGDPVALAKAQEANARAEYQAEIIKAQELLGKMNYMVDSFKSFNQWQVYKEWSTNRV